MLERCLTKIKNASIIIPTINQRLKGQSFVLGTENKLVVNSFLEKLITNAVTKIENVATKDASEMYLLIKNTVTNTTIAIMKSIGE